MQFSWKFRSFRRAPAIGALVLASMPPLSAQVTTAEIRHPDLKYVDQSIPPRFVRFAEARLAAHSSAPTRVLRATKARMGSENGSDNVVLSGTTAVVINGGGQTLLLDEASSTVRVFDASGRFVQRVGRAGQGPGDFHHARVMTLGPSDELIVFDLGLRMQVFTQKDGMYRLNRTIPVSMEIQGMCFLGTRLFANASTEGGKAVIHHLDFSTGRVLRSFGSVYHSPSPATNYQVNGGRLVCDTANDQVVLGTSTIIGEIRAWKANGTPVWRLSVEDYKSNIVKSVGGRRTVELSPDGITSLHALTIVPGVGIVANYGLRTRQQIMDKEAIGAPFTLVVNASTGAASWLRDAWPVIGAIRGNAVATVHEDPFPQVRMLTLDDRR